MQMKNSKDDVANEYSKYDVDEYVENNDVVEHDNLNLLLHAMFIKKMIDFLLCFENFMQIMKMMEIMDYRWMTIC
jgi:hypothetical protein